MPFSGHWWPSTLSQLVRAGGWLASQPEPWPARKLGRDWFVAPAALAAYVATRPPRGRPVTTGARRDPPRA